MHPITHPPLTFQHQYKGQRSISNLNLQCLNSKRTSKYPPYQTVPKRRWWWREEIQESKGPRVPTSKGPMDQVISKSKSHSNTSFTLKKVHLVFFSYSKFNIYIFTRNLVFSKKEVNLGEWQWPITCRYRIFKYYSKLHCKCFTRSTEL